LLIDLHSMPPLGPKTGHDPAADFVVGDRYGSSCASRLSSAAIGLLEQAGMRAAHNQPYAGGYVLDRHSAPQRGLHAMQLELCRTIYLDAGMREPGAGFERAVEVVAELVRHLAGELSRGWRSLPQAAE
jgi:N-formylglutamate amidohydrolase